MVLYVSQFLGVRPALAGMALTVYGLGGLVSGPIAGRLCDRFGAFTILRGSLVTSGAILLMFPLVRDFTLFLALTFLWAMVAESGRPASLAALTSFIRPDQRKAAIALNRLAINLGMSIGPAVGGFLATLSFPLLFLADGATALAAGLFLAVILARRPLMRHAAPPAASDRPAHQTSRFSSVLHDPHALLFLAGLLLVFIVFHQPEGAMSVYLVRDLHYPPSFYGTLFVANTILIVLIELPLNLAMQKWSHRSTITLGAVLIAAGFGSMALLHTRLGLLLSVIVWTFGEMIAMPATGAYITDLAPQGRSGEYAGAYSAAYSLSLIVGPWAGIIALERIGGTALWCAGLIVGLIGAAALNLTLRTTQPAR
jgi:predicted MFS family arabinose efflux permease